GGDKYCIGYLTYKGGNILSKEAWQKGESPLMQTDMEYSEVIAPGHNSITKSADGSEDWILYHSAKKSLSGWDRQARLQKMTWNGNIPIVESISKYSSEVSLPSGEIVKRFKFEAENALLNGSNIIEVSEERASNSKAVSILESNFIQFEIDVSKNGVYALGVRYANRDSSTTTLKLNINGSEVNVFTPLTQYDDLYNVSWIYTDLYIKPTGSNVIQISGDKSIYVDCIIVDYLDK
ncbi:MAG: family 43 glycosylhydrolase, partial [Bacillales bacterium]|nr:family 43 glycosylhydrolase [Bacillales bacterium]